MDINYWWAGLSIVLMVILVIWLISRNLRDEKTFEKELIHSELKPKDGKGHDKKSLDNI